MSGINGAKKSASIRAVLAKRWGPWCFYCGGPFDSLTFATIDHYVPMAKGGTGALRNLRLACSWCNRRKGALAPEDFEAGQTLHARRVAMVRSVLRTLR